MGPSREIGDLTPIEDVARQLDMRSSAIRYYEERGLVTPSSRHAGRRWYGQAEIRRLAIVRFWQRNGLMSLDEIKEIIDGPDAGTWPDLLQRRIADIGDQIARLQEARAFLEHIGMHHADEAPDGCPHYEHLLFDDAHPRVDT